MARKQIHLWDSSGADLWGDHLRLDCIPTNRFHYGDFLLWFKGHAARDSLKGAIWLSEKQGTRKLDWTARREKSDFTGSWEWLGPKTTPVRLKVQRQDGRLKATYEDKNRDVPLWSTEKGRVPVSDIYDFGGGFYFTLLLGSENGSRRTGPDCGWLIGDGIAVNDSLVGAIAFYPYPDDSDIGFRGSPQTNTAPLANAKLKSGSREWQAKRVVNTDP